MHYSLAVTFATTIAQSYVLFAFSDMKFSLDFKSIFAIISVIVVKPFVMLLLKDNLLSFIFVWFCIYIIAYFCLGKNFKRRLELSFFVEMITLMAYYMSSGILLIMDNNIDINDIFNFNILLYPTNNYFIWIYLILFIAFGMLRRYIPISFQESDARGNYNGIYIIMAINIFIKIINDLNVNYGIKLILFVSINMFILIFYIINNQLNTKYIKDELELKEKEKRIKELTLYIGTIEELVEKYREFKHDYKNIVLGMGAENINEYKLLEKLNKEVVGDKNYDAFLNLKNIDYTPLKSILSYYIMLSIKNGVEVSLITIGNIMECSVSELEISRIMGIILENALEETQENNNRKIEIFVEDSGDCLNIAVANTFKKQTFNLDEIYKRGYSSKGENRGLGLYNLKTLVGKNSSITLNTFINEDMFTQDLYIKNAKRS
jgi:two-component system sensor histidine kinase AgrC